MPTSETNLLATLTGANVIPPSLPLNVLQAICFRAPLEVRVVIDFNVLFETEILRKNLLSAAIFNILSIVNLLTACLHAQNFSYLSIFNLSL